MHGLTEIIRLNDKAQAKVNGIVANSRHSDRVAAIRDAKVERAVRPPTKRK